MIFDLFSLLQNGLILEFPYAFCLSGSGAVEIVFSLFILYSFFQLFFFMAVIFFLFFLFFLFPETWF